MDNNSIDFSIPVYEGYYEENGIAYKLWAYIDDSSTDKITNRYIKADTPKGRIGVLITLTNNEWKDYYFDTHLQFKKLYEVINEMVSKDPLPVDWEDRIDKKIKIIHTPYSMCKEIFM